MTSSSVDEAEEARIFDEIESRYRGRLQLYKDTFSRYFPKILDDEDEARFLLNVSQISRIKTENIPVTDMASFRSDLRDLKKAVFKIANHNHDYVELLGIVMEDRRDAWIGYEVAFSIVDFIRDMSIANSNGILRDAWDEYEEYANIIARDYTKPKKNINWTAVTYVRNLRRAWKYGTGRNAPTKALNPASRFAAYLRDGFTFFEVKGDPASAFKRWAVVRQLDEKQGKVA